MRYWLGAAFAFLLAVLQAASIDQFKVLGVVPNLMLVVLVAWLVVRGLEDVLPMIFVAGVTLGLIGLQTPGLILLALLPVAALGVLRELHIVHSDAVLTLLIVLGASLAYESVLLLSVMASGGSRDVITGMRSAVIPATLVNLALALPVYFAMRFARTGAKGRRLSY